MMLWYAIAKTTQAYTVVANPVGGSHQGSSGIFTIDPVDSDVPPIVGSLDRPEAVRTTITTLGDPRWFMDQHRLIGGRRPDLAVPLMLPVGSTAFVGWRDAPGYDITAWSAYRQGA
jgi:hypothetical protein